MEEDVRIEAKHDYSPIEAEAIEDRLYEYNRGAAGAHDGRTLGHVRGDSAGSIVGAAYGYSWAGISELKQLCPYPSLDELGLIHRGRLKIFSRHHLRRRQIPPPRRRSRRNPPPGRLLLQLVG